MVATTTTDQATTLLSRRVAEARRGGALSPDAEAIALFESIALNMLLEPRSALLFALLAKNGLRKAVSDELTSIDTIKSAINDLGNVVLDVTSTKQLDAARASLLQLEQLDRISTASNQYKKFDSSVSEFLNKVIAKSVRSPGATSLTRPGTEAATDLVAEFTNLVELHSDTIDRLYAIIVGVDNFLTSPLATVIGLTTASRARADIEDLIALIEETGSTPATQDMAIRLITDRAAVKVIGNLPSVGDPVLDTVRQLPLNYVVKGRSDPAAASRQSNSGPWAISGAGSFTVDVNGTSLTKQIPNTAFVLSNRAAIAGAAITFPITIPANYYLFVAVDGVTHKIGPLTAGVGITKTQFFIDFNASIAASDLAGVFHIDEHITPGTNRIIFYHDSASTLAIAQAHIGDHTDLIGGVQTTSIVPAIYTNSIHTILGFTGDESGTGGVTSYNFVTEALSYHFSSLVTVSFSNDQTFTITSIATTPGTVMTLSGTGTSGLGIVGSFFGMSDTFALYGTVQSVPTDPVSPIGVVDISDTVVAPTGTSTILNLTATRIQLATAIPTFDGNLTINSALTLAYQAAIALLNKFLTPWLSGPFGSDLSSLNLAIATLTNGSPQSQRNVVLEQLGDLETRLQDLLSKIDDPSTTLSSSAAKDERSIVDGITASLEERKFDKALSLFLKCQIQEALDSTVDTASFGGSLLKAAADFARTDMIVPNRALDEQVEGTSSQSIKGL